MPAFIISHKLHLSVITVTNAVCLSNDILYIVSVPFYIILVSRKILFLLSFYFKELSWFALFFLQTAFALRIFLPPTTTVQEMMKLENRYAKALLAQTGRTTKKIESKNSLAWKRHLRTLSPKWHVRKHRISHIFLPWNTLNYSHSALLNVSSCLIQIS